MLCTRHSGGWFSFLLVQHCLHECLVLNYSPHIRYHCKNPCERGGVGLPCPTSADLAPCFSRPNQLGPFQSAEYPLSSFPLSVRPSELLLKRVRFHHHPGNLLHLNLLCCLLCHPQDVMHFFVLTIFPHCFHADQYGVKR